jgi:hypothetical protein
MERTHRPAQRHSSVPRYLFRLRLHREITPYPLDTSYPMIEAALSLDKFKSASLQNRPRRLDAHDRPTCMEDAVFRDLRLTAVWTD